MHYVSDAGIAGKVERNIPEVYAADGQWHSVLIEKNGSATILSVDRTHSRDILHTTQDFGGLNVLTISLGGIPSSQPFKSTVAGNFFFNIAHVSRFGRTKGLYLLKGCRTCWNPLLVTNILPYFARKTAN